MTFSSAREVCREIKKSKRRGKPSFEVNLPEHAEFTVESRDDRTEIDIPAEILDMLPVDLEYDNGITVEVRTIPGTRIKKLRMYVR